MGNKGLEKNLLIAELHKNYAIDIVRAIENANELEKIGRESSDYYAIATATYYRGRSHFIMGKNEEAMAELDDSIEILKEYGYEELLMQVYNMKAVICCDQEDEIHAVDYYYASLQLAIRYEDYILQGMIYNNIGNMLLQFAQYEKALQYYEHAYQVVRNSLDPERKIKFSIGRLYMNMASVFQKWGKYQKAKEYYDRALLYMTQEEYKVFHLLCIGLNALLQYELGQKEQAYRLCMEVMKESMTYEGGNSDFEEEIDVIKLLIRLKAYEEASKFLKHLTEVNPMKKSIYRRLMLYETYVMYYRAVKDRDKLFKYYQEYYRYKKQLSEHGNGINIAAIDNRFSLENILYSNEQINRRNQMLRTKSEHDELTGLYNRYGLNRLYDEVFNHAVRNKDKFGLMILDVDNFKNYNDEYGHIEGDQYIVKVAKIIETVIGTAGYCGRYGGDEFFVLILDQTDEIIQGLANQIMSEMTELGEAESRRKTSEIVSTISIGFVNAVPEKGQTVSEFIHSADMALYHVKRKNKNGFYRNQVIK